MSKKEPGIRMDLNENPFNIAGLLTNEMEENFLQNNFNRYPDPKGLKLKESISNHIGIDRNCISLGNGSDELIMLLFQGFLKRGEKLLIHIPTFTMYQHYANIAGAEIVEYQTDQNFDIDLEAFKGLSKKEKPKLVILCNPNNPTGKLLEVSWISDLANDFEGIIVIDEAYIEFCNKSSIALLQSYKNIIILRTFSKAFGLAGIRVGYMLSSGENIDRIEKIRSPFNINSFSQAMAALALENFEIIKNHIEIIREERKKLYKRLSEMKNMEVFESQANFILVRTKNKQEIMKSLIERNIKIRSFESKLLQDCLRITVGTPYENEELMKVLEAV